MLTKSHIQQYFQRIGIGKKTLPPTHATLCKIMHGHLMHIPYGNVDIYASTSPSISVKPEAIFEKLVVQGREGYCIEHCVLLREILLALKFELISTVTRGFSQNNLLGPNPRKTVGKFTHLVNIVIIDDVEYLADVGFGHWHMTTPVPITRDVDDDKAPVVECPGPTLMRIVTRKSPVDAEFKAMSRYNCFRLQIQAPNKKYSQFVELNTIQSSHKWNDSYSFTCSPAYQPDYEVLNYYITMWPNDPLNTTLVFRKLLDAPSGYLVLAFNTLRVFHGADQVKTIKVTSKDQRSDLVKQHFGITLPTHLPLEDAYANKKPRQHP
ncbi:hypothetical protein DSO57_1002853 [Entomophthora muscae]|uniref:Uncharacterized protein n=1 Tax=Entomophthora muscae TaxID=34485 RepID=A0ACC2TWB8_9FUNG|nr:hypothetical protein DSO57_1002853 [Entomophthora muscae]